MNRKKLVCFCFVAVKDKYSSSNLYKGLTLVLSLFSVLNFFEKEKESFFVRSPEVTPLVVNKNFFRNLRFLKCICDVFKIVNDFHSNDFSLNGEFNLDLVFENVCFQ